MVSVHACNPPSSITSSRHRATRPAPAAAGRGALGSPEACPRLPGELGRLVQLVRDHDRLVVELQGFDRQLAAVRSYLAEPGCHARLGHAQLERLRVRRSGVLALLRANRIEAAEVLGTLGT